MEIGGRGSRRAVKTGGQGAGNIYAGEVSASSASSGPESSDPVPAARPWPAVRAVLASAPLAGMIALLTALAFTGAAAASLLGDPGALVRWGLPVATMAMRTSAAVTIGALALCALVLPAPAGGADAAADRAAAGRAEAPASGRAWSLAARLAAVAAGAWTLSAVVVAVFTFARSAGRPVGGATFGDELGYFLTELSLGRHHLAGVLVVAALAVACHAIGTPRGAAWCSVAAFVALLPMALTGHAAGATSHDLAVSSLWLHVGAAAVWAGGLVVLCAVGPRLAGEAADAARRYSRMAGWCFVLVGLSGVVNAAIRIGSTADVLSDYGLLLVAKATGFAALGLMGWAHRVRTLRALPQRPRLFWRLAAGEVVLMAGVFGISVALGVTPPPVPQEPVADPGPVWALTGHPAPPPLTPAMWLTQWRLDVLFALVAVVLAGMYLVWARRLRRRGDAWPAGRTLAWLLGCLLFAWVTNGAPAVYGMVLFSVHMVQHMLLAMVIPILFVLGSPVTLAVRALPGRGDGTRGPREWLLAIVHSRWAAFFSHPVVAAANFAGSMIVFYYTPLFGLSLSTHVGHVLMVVHFTLAGYVFASVLIGRDPGIRQPSHPLRLVLLFATMAFHAFFGVAITQSTTLFAADHFGALGLPWWVDALADQHVGGAVTWGIGEIPTLMLAIAVALAWSRDDERSARRGDRQADRDHDAELVAYNARLAQLATRHEEAERRPRRR